MPRKRRFPSTVHPNAWTAPSAIVNEVPEEYPNRDIALTVIEENAPVEDSQRWVSYIDFNPCKVQEVPDDDHLDVAKEEN